MLQSCPSPDFHQIPSWVLQFRRDPLNTLSALRDDYGDIVCGNLGTYRIYFVFDPDLIHEILVTKAEHFQRTRLIKQSARSLIGNGLIASEGQFWKRQRKLMQPAFHHKRVQQYADVMQEYTLEMFAGWQDKAIVDIDHEMIKLTLGIVSKTLFGSDMGVAIAEEVDSELRQLQWLATQHGKLLIPIPNWFPLKSNRQKQHSIERLNQLLMGAIEQRRHSTRDHHDLLSMFMSAMDEDGKRMTDKQIRDEVVTIFLTGHDTSANVLTWAVYLLATHPEICEQVVAELDNVLEGRLATMADLPHLPLIDRVINETLRLYPPAWLIGRDAISDMQIGDYFVRKGSSLLIPMYTLHRDGRFFEAPDQFIPERFADENNIPKRAYIPFGAGQRHCIGRPYGAVEVQLILALLMQQYQFEMMPNQTIEAVPELTLHPKDGIQMRISKRQS